MGAPAILSMHGEGHANATRTRECVAMPGTRNQTVLTPQPIVDGLSRFWGATTYDPCHAEGSLIGARLYSTDRGLLDAWPDKTFCNPPYGDSLRDPATELWPLCIENQIRDRAKALAKLLSKEAGKKVSPKYRFPPGLPVKKASLADWLSMQIESSSARSIMLVPHRTHRKWYRAWMRELDAVIELDPLRFVGHEQNAPFPLALGFRWKGGARPEDVDWFDACFSHLGDLRLGGWR